MKDIEKIRKYEATKKEIKSTIEEIESRKKAFKIYIGSLIKDFKESQKDLEEELVNLEIDSKNLLKDTLTVKLSDLVNEISKEYGNIKCKPNINVWMVRPNIYLNEEALIRSIDENEKLKSNLSIYLPEIDEHINLMMLSTYLLKENPNYNPDLIVKVFCTDEENIKNVNNLWTADLIYDSNDIILNIPIYKILNSKNPKLKNAIFNCVKNVKKPKIKIKENGK